MPPKSSFATDPRIAKASKIFVNRDGPIGVFTKAALNIPAEGPKLLVFHGVGGQGKTALCTKLMSRVADDSSLSHLRTGLVDLHGREERDAARALVWLRNALARGKNNAMTFPAFDIAFANYWLVTRPDLPMPSFAARWLGRNDDFASDTVGAAGETAGEVLQSVEGLAQDLASATPFVGMALRRLTGWGIKKGRLEFHKRTNEALKQLFEDGELIAPREIECRLPFFLARDLDLFRQKKPEDRFVVFIDEYERVFDQGAAGIIHRENPLDKAFRDFAAESNGALLVFFSREKLPWPELDPNWTEDLTHAQHPVHGLAFKYAESLLKQAGVQNEKVVAAMIEGATARDPFTGELTTFPIMLELQLKHYFSRLENLDATITPEDFRISSDGFRARRNELVARFMRDYDSAFEATLKRIAVARWVDRDIFTHIVKSYATGFQLDRFDTVCQMSFVTELAEPGRFAVHSMIREAIKDISGDIINAETHECLFKHFDELSTVNNPRDIQLAHLEALAEAFFHASSRSPDALLKWWDEKSAGFDNPAFATTLEPLYHRVLEICERVLGTDHPSTASGYNNVASNLDDQGQAAMAEPFHRKALEIRERVLGPDHPHTAESCSKVATCLKAQGQATKAEPLHRKALEIRERVLGLHDPSTALSYNRLASCLKAQGRLLEAAPHFQKALEIRERVLGPDHPDTATSYNDVASCLKALGNLAEAEPLFRKAMEIRERLFGSDHPYTAMSYNNVASCLKARNCLAEAERLFRKALEIREHLLGSNHPSTAMSYNNLASCLRVQGQVEEAMPYTKKALEIRELVLGFDHPSTAMSYNNLAADLDAQGMAAEAEPLYRRALEIRERVLGPNHPSTASSYNNVAFNLAAQGRAMEAETLYRKALEIYERVLGSEHPDTATTYNNLAFNLAARGQLVEAAQLYHRALEIRDRVFGVNHKSVAILRERLESVQKRMNDPHGAN